MKTLYFNNEEFKAEKVVKTPDSIVGYNGNSNIPEWTFKGISDFSAFSLEEGQEWDIGEIEKLQQENADQAFSLMLAEGEALKARQEVADLNFTLMINGVI